MCFPNKIIIGGDERQILWAAVVDWLVSKLIGFSFVFCKEWLFLYVLNLWLQIVLEWLRNCCYLVLLYIQGNAGLIYNIIKYIVIIISRLLGIAITYIFFFFVIGYNKSYWNGCIKFATMIYKQIFLILVLIIILFKFLLNMLKLFWNCNSQYYYV